ncbi:hypothetical protein FHW18_005263 [Pigmentiphaga litoralis]|uniref:Uncharacterized protein n=1 Tax=Pigmentiphaga litoralis TaxID=516702 RepID=A0A7Y9IZL0_9BURK|nr:hypothetical protein [Pigmentiphaga litoralis]NYE85944.1 hypothetical protein [Pigmentiphaga litoralis]
MVPRLNACDLQDGPGESEEFVTSLLETQDYP